MSKTIDFKKSRYIPIVKYYGVLDYYGLLRVIKNAIEEQGYEFHETSVKHKIPSPIGAEQEFVFWGWKKVNAYIKFHVDIFVHTWDLHDVEVVREGKKNKLQNARLQIEMTGRCELDWTNRFGGSRFVQALADFYDNYIIQKDLDTIYTDQLYYRIYKIQQQVKEFLDFESKTNAFEDVW